MKKNIIVLLAVLVLALGCQDKTSRVEEKADQKKFAVSEPAEGGYTGTVVETMEVDRYTYVQVDTGEKKIWAATPHFQGKVGDSVFVPDGLPMENFHSNTLDRDFELIYFVGAISAAGEEQQVGRQAKMPVIHPPMGSEAGRVQAEISGIEKAEDGATVAEIFADKKRLAGKKVLIRGKVVKFLPEIMGKNWLHLQDGSGSEGTNDLTVTTSDTAKVGDLVLVRGKVSVNKDFGYGYTYEVILEDAQVSVE